ncbi:cAMP phosphodiesterases class-II-domain-containing protein [Apiosordaria backusii]|uniref:cAMP phosphodiesterases class-II-domain-containing protein n=1 Tax=Apiosordaria backusii TaxID=314023 RepID=A0AA40BMV2_9PEZI|nr:cAMP phosphodiesterases class-II-domain-containing protein [Apiosordaria backusii]
MGGGGGTVADGEEAGVSATRAVGDAAQQPALHVIVLGSGGGPFENNVTSFLVRSVSSKWGKSSVVAFDAGVHLGAIAKILEDTQPAALTQESLPHILTTGPFAGLQVNNLSPKANALDIVQDLIETYVISHPHLDHIAGLVINTAGMHRPKRLAGLPVTIEGFKKHIFNNVIWPNLSDENNGHGLITYMRLVEGGSPALGEGDTRGYLEIGDGLAIKVFSVSHGHCVEKHSHRGSTTSIRHGSFDASSLGPAALDLRGSMSGRRSPGRSVAHLNHPGTSISLPPFIQLQQQERAQSVAPGRNSSLSDRLPLEESYCVYDSSAYFFQHVDTGREILMFGDVEPDSESLTPRNLFVWQIAAPKIAAGKLTAIFIECSYDNSVTRDRLYGHLAPRYIAEEMTALAKEVLAARNAPPAPPVSHTYPSSRRPSHFSIIPKSRRASHAENVYPQSRRGSVTSAPIDNKKRKREAAAPGLEDAGDSIQLSKRKTTPQPQVKTTDTKPEKEDHPISPRTIHPNRRGAQDSTSSSNCCAVPQDYFLQQAASSSSSSPSNQPQQQQQQQQQQQHNHIQIQQSHTPHLATPTAELSLSDIEPTIQPPPRSQQQQQQEEQDVTMQEGPATPLSNAPPATAQTATATLAESVEGDDDDVNQDDKMADDDEEEGKEKEEGEELRGLLKGLKVVIIHVKDKLNDDGLESRDVIQEELWDVERELGLGVEFVVCRQGDSLFL